MILQSDFRLSFEFLKKKPIQFEISQAQISSDAGLLPLRQFDEQLGFTQQVASVLRDFRHRSYVEHSLLEMVRMRIYGIIADYPDQNDHTVLRSDPVFKLLCNRSLDDAQLASQATLSRFENAIDVPSLNKLRDVLIDQFIASFEQPPSQLTLDIDTFDDPTHGAQQLTFFHGFYDQYQYQPRVITCAENDLVVDVCLLYGSAHAALGAASDLEYLVQRLREAWPSVKLSLRADSAFGLPAMFHACQQLDVCYSIGLRMNPWLQKQSNTLMNEAISRFEASGETQRLFCAFWYRANSWEGQRWVIIKCEVNARGTNRRAIVTDRSGAFVLPDEAYNAFSDRGESENRNKELKCGLQADRLSDHRYFANLFRLFLHTFSYNLLTRFRNVIRNDNIELPADAINQGVPVEALSGDARRAFWNHRREQDPLGRGQPNTWRTRLIKVAALVHETQRRVVVQLSSTWPYLNHYQQVSQQILALSSQGFASSAKFDSS